MDTKSVQARSLEMLVRLKSTTMCGSSVAAFEQRRDARLMAALAFLAEMKADDEAVSWISSPCDCSYCGKLPERTLRMELAYSAFGFKHLLVEIVASKNKK